MITEIDSVQSVVSKFLGDLVSGVVSDGGDNLEKRIKDVAQNKKSYYQNVQVQIYRVVVDALNKFTYNKYNGQNELYIAADSMLKEFKSKADSIEAVKLGLKMLVSDVNDNTCKDFLEILFYEICKDENKDLHNQIDMSWKMHEREYVYKEFEKSYQNDREELERLNDLKKCVDVINGKLDSEKNYETEYDNKLNVTSRAEEYANKWDMNLFLNDFDKRDENAGVNVKLKDIYLENCLPHYIWKMNKELSSDLKELLIEYVLNKRDKKMLLILGQSGIGKSTLITWITANLIEKKEQILVYQFASDLRNINWQSDNIFNEILKILNLECVNLENKTLILDGFDEIHASNDREKILNQLYYRLNEINHLRSFSLIITCRENYVYKLHNIVCDYITLQTWDGEQIRSFCENYKKTNGSSVKRNTINKIVDNKEILGIPLILYMLMAFNIDIDKNGSIIDIYDRIFSLDEGSIYDRCIKNLNYASLHRTSAIKQQIYHVSQQIAFWIFENSSEKACIPYQKYEEICDIVMNESKEEIKHIKRDILLGNYFKVLKYCEGIGSDELHFVHYSIYEYFVAMYFFESICDLTSKEEIARKLGLLLKRGHLSQQILNFLKYKFENIKRDEFPHILKESFEIMIQDGMTYYVGESFLNVIDCEMNIFSNMLEIVHLWNFTQEEFNNKIVYYFRYNNRSALNLTGINLRKADLREISLRKANLREVDLREADLREADLREANLREANLRNACLIRAYLRNANLIGTNLIGANLSRADLSRVDLTRANLIETNLIEADLSGADLSRADLIRADLSKAVLIRADLNGADLREANLKETDFADANLNGTIFDEEQAKWLSEKCNLSGSMVYISEVGEIIRYEEYSIRN